MYFLDFDGHQVTGLMRQNSGFLLAVLCAASLGVHAADGSHSQDAAIKVVLPGGTYHATEIAYEAGPDWLALVEGAESSLMPVEMKIRTVFDPVLDSEDGPHTGKYVFTEPQVSAKLLVQGAPFRPGPVVQATVEGAHKGLSPKTLRFNKQSFSLQLSDECGEVDTPCEWVLSDGETRQTVSQLSVGSEDGAFITEADNTGLIWAGDLDRDGKLDLIVDVSDHYNAVAQVRVLLSSAAHNGQLFGEAGWFSAVGC